MIRKCSESSINKIFLMLGSACNFQCRYCLQTGMVNSAPHEPTEEVYKYIEHLIKIRPGYMRNKLSLLFWGGEPLLYMDIIRKVVGRLKDKVSYAIVTNGSLITDGLVDYFNGHDISITLSHDGVHTAHTRGKNILDDAKMHEMLSRIKYLSIESVTSSYNYDYAELSDYIDYHFGYRVGIVIDRLQLTWDMPEDIYDIPLAEYNEKLRRLAGQALLDMINMEDTRAAKLFQPHVDAVLANKPVQLPVCGAFYNVLNIDCNGNIFACHNTGEKIGHISEERAILAKRYDAWFEAHTDKNCKSCMVFGLCGGSCPLEHGRRQKMCNIYKTFYAVCMDLAAAFLNSFEDIDWSVDDND